MHVARHRTSKMQTVSDDQLFQTDAQLELSDRHARKAEVVKDVGNPIQLSSKALDLVVRGNDAWTAESGWQARRVDLLVRFLIRAPH